MPPPDSGAAPPAYPPPSGAPPSGSTPSGPPPSGPPPYEPYPEGGQPPGAPPGGYGTGGYGTGGDGTGGYGATGYAAGGYPAAGYPAGGYAPVSPYASWGARLGGWLIDFVILAVVGAILSAILRGVHVLRWTFTTTNNSTHVVTTAHFSFLASILQLVLVLLYGAVLVGGRRGQTVGMMAVGARAVDLGTGGPIGFWRGLGRAAFEQLLVILLFVPWVLDMLWPLWDGRNQTLHDKVTSTVVMKRSALPPTS